MITVADVWESLHSYSGITLVHIPTGCHVEVNASKSRDTNRKVAFRLLRDRIAQLEKISIGSVEHEWLSLNT